MKELTQLLGGRISIESAVGQGSTFELTIPIKPVEWTSRTEPDETSNGIETQDNNSLVLIPGRKPRILFVEDDLEMSRYLVTLFQKDFICDTAFNGQQALAKMEDIPYDLISSDVMMPEMDGFAFREQINRNEKWKNIPFIMLTARVLEEDKLRGFQLGIDDYITKPFSSAEIRARIINLLRNKVSRDVVKLLEAEELDHSSQFINQARDLVLEEMENEKFGVQSLAKDLNFSSRQLGRILQKYTGLSPVNFILEIRLQKAYELLRDRRYSTVKEVQYEVGIGSTSYFSRAFKKRFGISPVDLHPEHFAS